MIKTQRKLLKGKDNSKEITQRKSKGNTQKISNRVRKCGTIYHFFKFQKILTSTRRTQ